MGVVSNLGYAPVMRKPKPPVPPARRPRSIAVAGPPRPANRPNRIYELCKTHGLTQAQLADRVGANAITINKLANGKIKLTQNWMGRLAAAFGSGVRPEDFLPGAGTPATQLLRVRVAGELAAGAWRESFEWPPDDQFDVMIPADESLRSDELYAGRISGPSMNRIYPDGAVVVLSRKLQRPGAITEGKRYHVRRTRSDGLTEDTIKTLERGADGRYWLKPESDDPEHQQWLPLDGEPGATVELIGRVRFVVYRED